MDHFRPYQLVSDYDRMRLATYQEKGAKISIRSEAQSLYLRFDDVGYFNSVYSEHDALIDRLTAIEAFFRGSPHGCRLIIPTLSTASPLVRAGTIHN